MNNRFLIRWNGNAREIRHAQSFVGRFVQTFFGDGKLAVLHHRQISQGGIELVSIHSRHRRRQGPNLLEKSTINTTFTEKGYRSSSGNSLSLWAHMMP